MPRSGTGQGTGRSGTGSHLTSAAQVARGVDQKTGGDEASAQCAHRDVRARSMVMHRVVCVVEALRDQQHVSRVGDTVLHARYAEGQSRMRCLICLTRPCASTRGQPAVSSASAVSLSESSVRRTCSMSMIDASSEIRRERKYFS